MPNRRGAGESMQVYVMYRICNAYKIMCVVLALYIYSQYRAYKYIQYLQIGASSKIYFIDVFY